MRRWAHIDNDFECYQGKHGDLFHADDTDAVIVDVCYTAGVMLGDVSSLFPTDMATYKMKFIMTKIVYGTGKSAIDSC